jgi:competence transcription factor ComK
MSINVSFLLPNRTIQENWIVELLAKNPQEIYDKLTKISHDNNEGITCKIGNGSFRDKVEWNQIMRTSVLPAPVVSKRRGYQLITFQLSV